MITTTLGLLDEPHTFSQQSPLTSDEFERAAADRAYPFGRGLLARLHRDGVLVPLFGIDYDAPTLIHRSRLRNEPLLDADVERAMVQVNSSRVGLELEREVGDLFDPAVRGYESWARTRSFRGRRYQVRRHLYSPYQLLGIRNLRNAFPRGYPSSTRLRQATLPWAIAQQTHTRRLAILLTALEAAFRPAVVPRLSGFALDPSTWARFHSEFRVEDVLQRLGRTSDELVVEAENLLVAAHSFDPLRDWQPLVDEVDYHYLAKLRGEPLLAWEHRVAAETLLRAYESLVRRECASPLPELPVRSWAPRHSRIGAGPRDLDAVLMRFGLSPHPSVLVVAEGDIEEAILEPLFAERLRPGWKRTIRLHSMKGINRDVSALAEFVAPAISRKDGEWVELSRPPIRIVIVGDPEGSLASAGGRESMRQRWLDRLVDGLPREWRTEHIRHQLDGLIEIFLWGEAPTNFEFSHFTDEELADGILAVSRSPDTPGRDSLIADLAEYRLRARNIRSLWDRWRKPKPTKMRVVSELAPNLLRRVHGELETAEPSPEVPLARLVLRIIELSISTPRRGSVVLSGGPD